MANETYTYTITDASDPYELIRIAPDADQTTIEDLVMISLWSDARADPGDILPSDDDKRGWWADPWAPIESDNFGSRLWLYERGTVTSQTIESHRLSALASLQWLIVEGVAEAVEVIAERYEDDGLGIQVTVTRGVGDTIDPRFEYLWQGVI